MIPLDWTVSTVGDEFKVQLGKMIDSAKNRGVLKPYIGNRAVHWNRINLEELSFVRMTRSDLQRFRLQFGDLLVCEGGEIGRAAIWEDQLDECYYQKALHRLRPRRGCDTRLMLLLLELWTSNRYLANYVTQTSIAHLAKDQLERVPLPLPLPKEQTEITDVLSDVGWYIDALDKLIAKKRALKLATMHQLLTGKTRLPGFSKNWSLRNFDHLFKRLNTKAHQILTTEYSNSGRYPVIDQGQQDVIAYSDIVEKLFQCPSGGVIIFGDHTRIVKYVNQDFLVGADGTQTLLARTGSVTRYLYYLLLCTEIPNTGYARHFKFLKEMSFSVPAENEQRAIADVLSDMDAEIAALERRRDKTKAIKQGMLQVLLTGRIRLVKPGA